MGRLPVPLLAAILAFLAFALPGVLHAQQPPAADRAIRLRVGDVLAITLPGESVFNKDFAVDRNGRITLPEVGEVDVAGRTMPEAITIVRNALARAYRDLSRLQVGLKERRLVVTVLGYVVNPGEVNLPVDAGIQQAIGASGGLQQGAQLDKLQLRRDGKTSTFDYKKYLDTGDVTLIPQLQPLDEIFVPSSPATGNVQINFDARTLADQGDAADATSAVKVFGEVTRAGSFGYKPGLTVVDMILRAGGITQYASVEQIRVMNGGEPIIFNMKKYLDTGDEKLLPPLSPGAIIFVPKQADEIRRSVRTVYVIGEVNRPGPIEAPPDSRLMEILANAGGPTRYAETRNIRVLKADGGVEPFDLVAYTEGTSTRLPLILPGDAIFVPEKIETSDRPSWLKVAPNRAVQVMGEVNRPGRYEWSDEMSLLDLLGEAGGPNQRADIAHLQILQSEKDTATPVTFDLQAFLSNGGSLNQLPKIRAGNVIRMPSLPESPIDNKAKWVQLAKEDVIYIMGQVQIPGRYAFNKNMSFLDILSAANGPTQTADLRNVRVSHRGLPGSKVTQVNLAQYFATGDDKLLPRVKTGDVIFIPDRANKEWFDDSRESTVRVLGAVARPGRYRFDNSMTLLDLLAEAGGPTSDAYQQKIVVVNLGCCREQARIFDLIQFAKTGDIRLLPVVQAGDTVYVPTTAQSGWKIFMDGVQNVLPIVSLIAFLSGG